MGEVVDKITILQIKEKHILDDKKLKYVREELRILSGQLEQKDVKVPPHLFKQLRKINQELWDTEDIIRSLEAQNKFDEEFIEHARLDAKLNDERFLVKNKINNHCNSLIKEQKSYDGLYTAD
jgi:hypothetical protein